jgi:hypothetical protein
LSRMRRYAGDLLAAGMAGAPPAPVMLTGRLEL